MTVATTEAKAGPYTGNDVTTAFAFSFKVFADTDIRVVETVIASGAETDLVLNTDYTVSRNADQDNDPGGEVTYSAGPLPSTRKLTIVGDFGYEQPTDIPNGGAFLASVIENALDRITLLVKQLKEQVDRSVKIGVSSSTDPDELIAELTENVATASEAATSAAASYDAFDDRYLGAKDADPTVDNDGGVLITGALYWSTAANKLRIWDGAQWQDTATATPASFTSNLFSGNGSTTAFTLSTTPANVASMVVSVSGVLQRPTTDYTVSGTTLTFTSAPASGTNNILAMVVATASSMTPQDGSVTLAKFATGLFKDEDNMASDSATSVPSQQSVKAYAVPKAATATLTAGYAATPYNAGTKSSGTFTPSEANGNLQYYTNNGAHTLAPPTNNTSIVIQVTNGASAGTVTTSGFTKVSGSFTTTNGDDFMCYIVKLNGFSHLNIQALQ